ncbi:hypothetical protein F5X68DRAFT_263517 [Plectosphaerella plurivora]|uniref:Uncharacterized protein n=1 Tax=Plectosphaerella plurivora TaxID=936078 RepID=A0A9P9AA60_9PEZI|nr:hypothetical protein F5X68DRAFT_263517 [Plectosphaerella plurivora]
MSQSPWPGPSWQNLAIDANCTAYGLYASWILDRASEPPIPDVFNFWQAVQNTTSSPPNVLKWHEWTRFHRHDLAKGIHRQLHDHPECRKSLCRAVDSEVPQAWWLAVFSVPAILITLYYIMALTRFFVKPRRPDSEQGTITRGILWRVTHAFSSTSNHLLSAAAVVTLAIQTSKLLTLASPPPQGPSVWSAFLIAGAFFVLASTVPLVLPTTQEKWFKGAVYTILFVLSTAGWAISVTDSEEMYKDSTEEFAQICPYLFPHTGALQAAVFTTAGMVWMPPLFGICILVALCGFRCNGRRMWQATWVNTVAKLAAALYGVVNLLALWGIMGTLASYVNRVPMSQRKSVWGLEQTLLVAVWAPVVAVLFQKFFSPTPQHRAVDALTVKPDGPESESFLR